MLGMLKPDEVSAWVFIDIAVIVVVARAMGALFRRLHQPAVVGEIVAGILLGPSVLGAFPGDLPGRLFPPEQVRPALNVVAQLGLIIFMFVVGLELDTKLIRGKERTAAVISVSSIVLPFSLGAILALGLYKSHSHVSGDVVDRLPFALFIGASMSVTAFPVLARILLERRMNRTRIGVLALACAAVDDIIAWSLLAVVLAVVQSKGAWGMPLILLESLVFVAFMFGVVKPALEILKTWYARAGQLTPNILAVVVVGFLVSAFVTSKIGIHSIFGAFVFGVVMPREQAAELSRDILERLEQISVLLLLPVFFVITGLNVNVRGLGADAFTQLPLILLVACVGKFVGAAAAARLQRVNLRQSAAIGILMNTRGLTELVILNVGREFGVLDDQLFTMLVVMAVFTTIITEPALRLIYPDRVLERERADAERQALGDENYYRLLIVSDDAATSDSLTRTAIALGASEPRTEVVLTRFLPLRRRLEVGAGLVTELADMTASLEELNAVAEGLRGRGIRCAVRSQFSDDVARDLLAQARAVRPDVVLMSRGTQNQPVLALATSTADWQWVVVDDARASVFPDASHPILVVADDENALADLELAVRIAYATGAPIALDGAPGAKARRHASRLEGKLTELGLLVSDAPEEAREGEIGMLVAGIDETALSATSAAPGFTLLVRAADGSDGEGLDRLLESLQHQSTRGSGIAEPPAGLR